MPWEHINFINKSTATVRESEDNWNIGKKESRLERKGIMLSLKYTWERDGWLYFLPYILIAEWS